MAIRRATVQSKENSECQSKIEAALEAWSDGGFKSSERADLDALYRECSNFSADCPVCLQGREEFGRALDQLKNGNILEGLSKMKSSFSSVRYKWSKFKDSLLKTEN